MSESEAAAIRPSRWRHLGSALAVALVLALAAMLGRHWQQLPAEMMQPAWGPVALSLVLLIATVLGHALQWRKILRALGQEISLAEAVYIHCLSQTGKYLPGKVALLAGKVVLAVRQGLSSQVATASVVYELALFAVSGSLATLLFASMSSLDAIHEHRGAVIALCTLSLAGLHPAVMGTLLRAVQRVLRVTDEPLALSYFASLKLLLGYSVPWSFAGASFFVFVSAFQPVSLWLLPDLASIWVLCTIIGLVALFAPAGIGVRDAALAGFLSLYFPMPASLAIAVAYRVATTLVDLLVLLLALSLRSSCRERAGVRAQGV